MEVQKLFQELREMEMEEEMKERIINHCSHKSKENRTSKSQTLKRLKKPMVAVATLASCFCLLSVTALATTDKLQGFFKDITDWKGAVTGTSYEQATDEINLCVFPDADELTITAEIVNPDAAPYRYFEALGLESYEIINTNGTVVLQGNPTEFSKIENGKATFTIPLSGLSGGNPSGKSPENPHVISGENSTEKYKLVIKAFVGSSKADQPLTLNGIWECDFTH